MSIKRHAAPGVDEQTWQQYGEELEAVVVVALFGCTPLTMAIGVGLAIFVMNLTHTTHPPGGATALIGVQGAIGPGFSQ